MLILVLINSNQQSTVKSWDFSESIFIWIVFLEQTYRPNCCIARITLRQSLLYELHPLIPRIGNVVYTRKLAMLPFPANRYSLTELVVLPSPANSQCSVFLRVGNVSWDGRWWQVMRGSEKWWEFYCYSPHYDKLTVSDRSTNQDV